MVTRPARILAWLAMGLLVPRAAPAPPTGQEDAAYVAALRGNVVRVVMPDRIGFGFVVGIEDRQLLVATAEHTLEGSDAAPRVCVLGPPETCATATVSWIADLELEHADLDLALLATPYPDGLPWRPDAMATANPGEPVWFIGRDSEWFIPERPGRILTREDSGTLHYEELPVAGGTSGAPIVSAAGIVAMHTHSAGRERAAGGVALTAIRDRFVERRHGRWILVPRQECTAQATHRPVLAGRTLSVYFDWARPADAMDAMARLHCLGARTVPRPIWTPADRTGDGITYRSGDLRVARALQTVLAPFGRLDAHLGQPSGDADIWIRP